jgi:hypothetical protein
MSGDKKATKKRAKTNSYARSRPRKHNLRLLWCAHAKKSEHVYEFCQKISIIIETLLEAGIIEEASLQILCAKSGIPLSTLNSAINAYGASISLQNKLCSIAKFNREDETWIDRSHLPRSCNKQAAVVKERKDTSIAFQQMLRARWQLGNAPKLRLNASWPQCREPNLAAISVAGGQSICPGETLPVLLQLTFTLGYYQSGYTYGFRSVRIRFKLDADLQKKVTAPLGVAPGNPVKLRDALLRGAVPFWELSKPNGSALEGEYVTAESPLFEIVNVAPGNKFQVILEARVYSNALARADGRKINSRAKAVIIERLIYKDLIRERQLLDEKHGWLCLAVQDCSIAYEADLNA